MSDTINNISSPAVEKATGRTWDRWIAFIDERGGDDLDHKGIVALVKAEGGVEKGWWQQTVTVGYEHAKGRRVVGQTGDAGYQIGVQRVIPLEQGALWDLLASEAGLGVWLGPGTGALTLAPGEQYATRDGFSGEVRTVKAGHKLRLTWQPADRDRPTTLQLSLSCPRNTEEKTTLRFHHEKLDGTDERDRMRAHWKGVLDALVRLANRGPK